jgi:hypothetical protein
MIPYKRRHNLRLTRGANPRNSSASRITPHKRPWLIRGAPASNPTAATVSNRDDLHTGDRLPKDDHERNRRSTILRVPKSCRGYCSGFWPVRSICTVQLLKKHPGGPPASSRIPIHSRLGLFQRSRVDSQGLVVHGSSCSRRRLRAALQEISSTVPSSICFSRSSISLFHASAAPSSTVASRLSIRESISAERASRGKARASRSSSAGWLSMNRFYSARRLWPRQLLKPKR